MMHRSILAFSLLISSSITAQDTLREQNSAMYNKEYVLLTDNRFEYYFYHCTGLTYGKGKLRKGLLAWKFEFDVLESVNPSSECTASAQTDSIHFVFNSFIDDVQFTPFLIEINHKAYGFEDKITVAKSDIVSDSIPIRFEGELFYIQHDWQNCGEITVHIHDKFKTYITGGSDVLIKRRKGLFLKDSYRVLNVEEPWKKGKRVVRFYPYTLI